MSGMDVDLRNVGATGGNGMIRTGRSKAVKIFWTIVVVRETGEIKMDPVTAASRKQADEIYGIKFKGCEGICDPPFDIVRRLNLKESKVISNYWDLGKKSRRAFIAMLNDPSTDVETLQIT
ncbi:MAG TPA: hypothetical protein VHQ41_01945 [Patescibacteria group bacterium]|nr:hypothetical protein [Patescibacteria group bacterium]